MTNEEIIKEIRAGGDRHRLISQLYEQNRGLIAKWANQWRGRAEFEDLMQEGFLALVAAVDAFDEDAGCKFSTYLTKVIWRHFARLFNGSVRLPEWLKEDIAEYRIFCRLHEVKAGSDPEEQLAAAKLHWTVEHVRAVKQWATMITLSLDAPITKEEDSGTLEGILPDPDNGIDKLIDDISDSQMNAYLWSIVDELPDQQRTVIKNGYKDNKTMKQTGEELHISTERVRQITAQAMRTLRRPSNSRRLQEVLDYYGIGCHMSGLSTFRKCGSSSVELAVIRKEFYEKHPEMLRYTNRNT